MPSSPSLQMRERTGAEIAHLLVCHPGLLSELGAHLYELLHGDVMKKPAVLIAVSAIILIERSVRIRSQERIVLHRHRTALAEPAASVVVHAMRSVTDYIIPNQRCIRIRRNENNRHRLPGFIRRTRSRHDTRQTSTCNLEDRGSNCRPRPEASC